jgi:hypothetical protein
MQNENLPGTVSSDENGVSGFAQKSEMAKKYWQSGQGLT